MGKEKLPAIHLYPGDWLRDSISGCSLAAQGLWLRMMFVAHDAPNYGEMFATDLLGSKASIARRCGCTLDEFELLFEELKTAEVPGISDGLVYSRRMVRDASTRAARVKAGRKGGKQTAKQKRSKTQAKHAANTQQNTEIENDNDTKNESLDSFEDFWRAFPSGRKRDKGSARKAWLVAVEKHPAAEIVSAASEYAASEQGRGEYVKMPSSWLNGECWSDDRDAWKSKGNGNGRRNDIGPGQRHDSATATRPPSVGWSD
jgi:hypothetical protein